MKQESLQACAFRCQRILHPSSLGLRDALPEWNLTQLRALPLARLQVSYSYSSLGLLQKPLLLAGVLGAIFAVAIVLGRGGLASLAASPSVQNVVAKPHAS